MNIKLLIKAMSFMFIPTLSVLLMLLVGFFDPIALWQFIKSDSGWAILIRVLLFVIEIGLVAIMYYRYEEEEEMNKLKENPELSGDVRKRNYSDSLYELFGTRDGKFISHRTAKSNFILIERKPEE